MSDQKRVKIKYKPRDQFRPFHNRKQRWSVLVCHRRAGKTVATLNDLIRGAVNECKPEGRYAFIFPLRNQAKDTAWRYLRRYAEPLLAKPPNKSELRVDLVNGSMIRLYGADNPDALRGPYLDGVVLDEFGDMKPEVWHEVVRPMLADRRGWATFIGTPKGKNEFFRLYESAKRDPTWFHMMLNASDSGIISSSELADLQREMGEDQYQQEFECSFEAAIKGAFYADEMRTMLAEGRIRPIEIEKEVRVHTAWDLGVSNSTAIWFVQCVGRERRLVDYYEGSGVGLNHYAQVLHDKRIQQGWKYGDHYFPHDITVLFHHSRIKPKNRDFSKALKRYFPEGFSIQRERATAICRVHPPVTDRRGRSPSLAKLKAARDRKIAAGEKVRRPQELRGSTAWRCRAGPSVTPLRSRSPADLFTLFLPNAAMSRQPAGHTKLRPSRLPDRCQS